MKIKDNQINKICHKISTIIKNFRLTIKIRVNTRTTIARGIPITVFFSDILKCPELKVTSIRFENL